jgi:signal peptide peptidase SppA
MWFSDWAIIPEYLHGYVATVKASDLSAATAASLAAAPAPLYSVTPDGLAVIDISGPMAKYGSSVQAIVGGTSTLEKRAALRSALRDPEVRGIVVKIDSPGGVVSGSGDLAAAVAATDKVKPVYAFIEDLGASAAYRVASRARKVYANADAQVGSIGTYATLIDSSGAYAKEGVTVEVISTGEYKGLGVDGTPITDKQRAETQRRVNALNEQFLADVSMGRRMPMDKVRRLADGRVHMAAAAKELGLIDSVSSWEQATQEIGRALMEEQVLEAATARAEAAEAKVAELVAKAAKAEAALAEIARKERQASFEAKVAGLKNLKAPVSFAAALEALQSAAPEAFAVLEAQISAWDAQSTTAGLFSEIGTSASGPSKVDTSDPVAFRAAADALVKAEKFKDRPTAMAAILREQGERK